MYTIAILVGLALVAVAVGALAGPWWGVLLAGVVLVAGGVLGESYGVIVSGRTQGERP